MQCFSIFKKNNDVCVYTILAGIVQGVVVHITAFRFGYFDKIEACSPKRDLKI
jgi:hypothetical protein